MSCYHPLKAFDTGYLTDNGKPLLKICSSDTDFIYKPISAGSNRFYSDIKITKYVNVPCGRCIGCRLQYSREWADRCMLESMNWQNNAFITLTYDDANLTYIDCVKLSTGEVDNLPTLVSDDLTKFMKDLRRYYKYHYDIDNIRFYACGEYGEQHGRPHFHIIAFNLPVFDKKPFFKNELSQQIYTSEIISQIWSKGLVSVADVEWDCCAYTARYVVKKQKGDTAGCVSLYENNVLYKGLVPEFTRCSRKPGIAREYYENNKDKIYENDEIILSVKGKARKIKPSHYYDKLFDLDSPLALQAIKERRVTSAVNAMQLQLEKTSLTEQEYLQVKENNKLESVKALKRKLKNV